MEQSEKDLRNRLLELIKSYLEESRDILCCPIREFSREYYAKSMVRVAKNIEDVLNGYRDDEQAGDK